MPRYDYRCEAHGLFEAQVERGAPPPPCPTCALPSQRELSVPNLHGATVAKNIPEPEYRREAKRRASRAAGWDVDRAVREMRKSIHENERGEKEVRLSA